MLVAMETSESDFSVTWLVNLRSYKYPSLMDIPCLEKPQSYKDLLQNTQTVLIFDFKKFLNLITSEYFLPVYTSGSKLTDYFLLLTASIFILN